ncbi:MAG: hypothetical protein ACK5P7_08600 [Bdellovibrio sp.]|jgi:hypothetical protein
MGYPVLADHFFQDQRPTREFFARLKERGPWSPSLLPIYEWQGILFVAFSNLDDVAIAQDWCPVQANPSLMMELYFDLTTEASVIQDPAALELLADEAPTVPPGAPSEDDFGGLDLSPDEEKLKPQASEKTEPAVDLTALTKATPPPPPLPEFDDLSLTPNPATSATPLPAAGGLLPDSSVETELWSKMSQYFEASMICLFQKGQVLPVSWSPNLKNGPAQAKTYSTLKASPFRIVARTQKPYHGYLVPNEISDTFFREWTQGTYPEHLTMSPILSGELIVGFLMGWGKSSAGTKDALTLCETSAKQISSLALKYAETNFVAA